MTTSKKKSGGGWLWTSKKNNDTENVKQKLKDVVRTATENIFKKRIDKQIKQDAEIQKLANQILKLEPSLTKQINEIIKMSTKKTDIYKNNSTNYSSKYVINKSEREIIASIALEQKKTKPNYARKSLNRSSLVYEVEQKFYEKTGENKRQSSSIQQQIQKLYQ